MNSLKIPKEDESDSGGSVIINEELSKGSSVSTDLQEEYNELLKYTLLTPEWQKMTKEICLPEQLRLVKPIDDEASDVDDLAEYFEKDNSFQKEKLDVEDSDCNLTNDNTKHKVLTAVERKIESKFDDMQKNFQESLDHSSIGRDNMILQKLDGIKFTLVTEFIEIVKENNDKHNQELSKVQESLDINRDLVEFMEKSLQKKDIIISKLLDSINKLRDRNNLEKSMAQWKIDHFDKKRLDICSKVAEKFHNKVLLKNAFHGWHETIKKKWKNRMMKACRVKADTTVNDLVAEYEAKLDESDARYAAYKTEIEKLRVKLDRMTQQMQKAFMRGVCALNYEARTVFDEGEQVLRGSEEVVQITRDCSEDGKCCNVASTKNNMFSGNTTPRCYAPYVPQTESELPYAYHHEVINNSNSVVREPLKTNKTNQKKIFAPSIKQKTSVKQKPRLVKGTPSKSISNACNHCPNKNTHPCEDVITGSLCTTAKFMQPPKLMPQKINKSKKKHSKNSILVERHVAIDKTKSFQRSGCHAELVQNNPMVRPIAIKNSKGNKTQFGKVYPVK